jgi:hypothetical protein
MSSSRLSSLKTAWLRDHEGDSSRGVGVGGPGALRQSRAAEPKGLQNDYFNFKT